MNRSVVKHVFFDLDHTIWDFDRNSALAFARVFQNHSISLEVSRFVQIYEPINFNYWKLFREERITKQELRRGRFQDAFGEFGIHFDMLTIDRLAESYIQELPGDNYLFEGAEPLLERLSRTYKLHIITNGFKEVQHGKLNQANIDHYFDTVTNSEMVGVKKPNPKIFNHALNMARAVPEQSIMIGDNYEADIQGALNMGFDAICFNYHKDTIANGIKVVDNLIDVKHYL